MAAAGILPDHWYYNTESGELTHGNNLENLGNNLAGGAGWHELNIPGSDTEAQASAAAVAEFPGGTAPTTSVATGEANALQGETGLTGINAIGQAFSDLGNRAFWLRAAKVVVGVVLIIIGVAHLARAGSIVSTAAKAAPL